MRELQHAVQGQFMLTVQPQDILLNFSECVNRRAIFEEALRDMRRAIPDIVEGVLERYGLCPPSRRARPIAVPV